MTAAPARAGRPRRQRSITESLLSIALGMEAAVLLFVALTALGLAALPAAVALGGGAAAILFVILLAGLQRHAWARVLGGVVQVGLIALGFVLTIMFLIGAIFAGIWLYCLLKSRQLERRSAANPLETTPTERTP